MSVRLSCPHCATPCLIPEQFLGVMVRCGACTQAFKPQAPAPELTAEEEVEVDPIAEELPADDPAPPLEVGCATSRGKVRSQNEDSFLVHQLAWYARERRHEVALLAVADGMGGHAAGDLASALVLRTVGAALAPLLAGALSDDDPGPPPDSLRPALEQALQEANRVVNQASQADPGHKGMGATAVAAVVWNGQVLLAHVGDCRAYHLHAGELRQVTTDQTVVARMIELGYISSEQAASHPARNEVTQAVGRHTNLHPDLKQLRLAPGDWLLLACDGLQANLSIAELQDEITMLDVPAPMLARSLVDRADAAGGSDNCTVIAVCCQSPPSPSEE